MNKEIKNKKLTGYPSIDKPWLKYYSEEAIYSPLPKMTMYQYIYENNKEHLNDIALIYYGTKITYGELFDNVEKTARAFYSLGLRNNDDVIVCSVNMPETVYALYALNRLGVVVNLVDPRTDEKTLRMYINECKAKIVLTVDLAYQIIKKAIRKSSAEKITVVSPSNSLSFVMKFFIELKIKQ